MSLQKQLCIAVMKIKVRQLDDKITLKISDALCLLSILRRTETPKFRCAPKIIGSTDWPPQVSRSCVPSREEESEVCCLEVVMEETTLKKRSKPEEITWRDGVEMEGGERDLGFITVLPGSLRTPDL